MLNVQLKSKVFKRSLLTFSKKRISGYFFTRQASTAEITKGQPVTVYESADWPEISDYLVSKNYFSLVPKNSKIEDEMYNIWQDCVMYTNFKPKYFALLPFFLEDGKTMRAKKKYCLKMELYPESKYLKFTYAMISGIHQSYEKLDDVIPLTPSDYRTRHLILRSRPPQFVDMDMLYGNRKVLDMYCFDKQGSWVKEVS
jgi:hypothetical protein